jgi:CRISPR-associated protein Cas2
MVAQLYIFCYDISSHKNRTKVAQLLEEYGQRVNKSVFECMLTSRQKKTLLTQIQPWVNPKTDNILLYPLCKACMDRAEYLHPPKAGPKIISI